MTIRRHAIHRAQREVRISSPLALDARRKALGYDALQEIEHQFQVPISGVAGGTAGYAATTLEFDVDFFDAPEQRDSSLSVPHFSFGAYVTGADVMVSCCVTAWNIDDRGAIVGADVSIGVCSPGRTTSLAYEGYVHLTFQGYGALSENIETLDVGV